MKPQGHGVSPDGVRQRRGGALLVRGVRGAPNAMAPVKAGSEPGLQPGTKLRSAPLSPLVKPVTQPVSASLVPAQTLNLPSEKPHLRAWTSRSQLLPRMRFQSRTANCVQGLHRVQIRPQCRSSVARAPAPPARNLRSTAQDGPTGPPEAPGAVFTSPGTPRRGGSFQEMPRPARRSR